MILYLAIFSAFFSTDPAPIAANTAFNHQRPRIEALDSSSFDFWLGRWKATWKNGEKDEHGQNFIRKDLNDKIIHESFKIDDGANKGFLGESFSVFDQTSNTWKQTWVDTDGSYLDFVGGKEADYYFFAREYKGKKGKMIRQRMRFYDIKPDSFTWDWEQSIDGEPWQLQWRIHYTRMK